MRPNRIVSPPAARRLWGMRPMLGVCAIAAAFAAFGGCRSDQKGAAEGPATLAPNAPPSASEPTATPAAPASAPSTAAQSSPSAAPAPAAATSAPASASGVAPTTPEASASVESIHAENTVEQNLANVQSIANVIKREAGMEIAAHDPRRRGDPSYERLTAARQRLVELYVDKKGLPPADHLLLCKAISRFGQEFQDAAANHCEAFLKVASADPASNDYRTALSTAAEAHFRAGADAPAEAACRRYLALLCESEKDPQQAGRNPFCRRIVTQYLPAIYHRLGDLDALLGLRQELKSYRYENSYDLLTLHGYLLQDLWIGGKHAELEKLGQEVLATQVWGERGIAAGRSLVPAALSAIARLRLLQGNVHAARNVYQDYQFEQSEAEPAWQQTHVVAPTRLIGFPAPPLAGEIEWLGEKPSLLPGGAPAEKLLLLAFVDAASGETVEILKRIHELAAGHRGQLVAAALTPRGDRLFDAASSDMRSGLDAAGFSAALRAQHAALKLELPLGVLAVEGRNAHPVLRAYSVHSLPTLVLIDKGGAVAAYHPIAGVDAGWSRVVETLSTR